MRMRSFQAPTIAEAMKMVRDALGNDAIIIASGPAPNGKGMQVTAAADIELPIEEKYENPVDVIGAALDKHATPRKLADKILTIVERLELDDPRMALAGAFDSYFKFFPIPENNPARPVMLVGVPGVGKTVTIAKLAARTVMAGKSAVCITTDSQRAGAVEQLEAFTKILKIDLLQAPDAKMLKDALLACPTDTSVYIDTAGVNILKNEEIQNLKELVNAANPDLVMAYAAGGNSEDAIDIAATFKDIGAKRLLVTRLDMTRRYGSVLAAADAGKLNFSDVSITPHVANGLSPINPVSLARLFLPN